MKTDSLLLMFSLFFASGLILMSKPRVVKPTYAAKAIGAINSTFKTDLKTLENQAVAFEEAAALYVENPNRGNEVESEYHQLRKAFKQVEFLLEYLDKEAFDKTLNGAPLPKLEKKVADLAVLLPKGMQPIDEFIPKLSKLEASERADFLKLVQQLAKDTHKIHAYLVNRRITDRQFFEASRQGMVRMATLGITGFDTPGTLLGVTDAYYVLKKQQYYFTLYKTELSNVEHPELYLHNQKLFEQALIDTNGKNFDEFNRLLFLKNVLNPIYKNIKDIHLALDYETINEVSNYPLAVNYDSDNLFASNFLNPFYYVSMRQDTSYNQAVALGKLLFYDPVLSENKKISCASCHAPDKAFTDGMTTSLSNTGDPLKRNAPTLNYSVYATGFFHDLRTRRLEDQFEHVVLSEDEFDSSYPEIIETLITSPTYKKMFAGAFPNNPKISSNNLDYALAAYVMTLNTFDNTFDRFFTGESRLTEAQQRGFNLFAGKAACATCHFIPMYSGIVPPLFNESEAEVLGVPDKAEQPWKLDDDLGRLDNGLTQEVAYFYRAAFKTPTLRNIEKTAPYMHNGVFNTLEEVMDFYNQGGGAGSGMELEHQTLADDPLDLTEQEIADIIAFMKALNDQTQFQAPDSLPRDFSGTHLNKRPLIGK